jgi:hypothetical protein
MKQSSAIHVYDSFEPFKWNIEQDKEIQSQHNMSFMLQKTNLTGQITVQCAKNWSQNKYQQRH